MISRCHVCGRDSLAICPEFSALRRVTSDCKPWPAGGKLGHCAVCGAVAASTDVAWRREADDIYRHYTIYYQGAGAEQSVFDQTMALSLHLFVISTQVPNVPEHLPYGVALLLITIVLMMNALSIGFRVYLRGRKKW